MTDLFGVKGRRWLGEQIECLPEDEQKMARACLRQSTSSTRRSR
jgi:hypothetical protein